jgi:DNA (cytosine-5)-methyltransferase 1
MYSWASVWMLEDQRVRPKFVDLYCGIGIGSLGFVKAGFQIAAAVDLDEKACTVYEANLGVAPIVRDLRLVSGTEILKHAGLKRGELPLMVGCPPCQGFSTLRRTRLRKRQRDARKSLLGVFGERVQEMLPRTVVLENVSGLVLGRNRRFLRAFLNRLRRLGYSYEYAVLDAADYGTPQHRRRLVLIGTKGSQPTLPPPTHSNGGENGKLPWKTVRDAIGDLQPLRAGQRSKRPSLHEATTHSESVLNIIRQIPLDGGGRRSLPRALWLPCHKRLERRRQRGAESIYGRMRWDAPSPTITTRSDTPSSGRFVHPTQNRGITLREAARLQSIPDEYRIVGDKARVARWIGNAMPLDLAQALGERCLSYV